MKPLSTTHREEQPSPAREFPSSHCSAPTRNPSPQMPSHEVPEPTKPEEQEHAKLVNQVPVVSRYDTAVPCAGMCGSLQSKSAYLAQSAELFKEALAVMDG
jgi:hypothetical protein